jgi:hypothetical protein
MADVQFIEFKGVEGAPRVAFPTEFSQSQIQDYMKSEQFQADMFGKGWRYSYGLKPVDMLHEDNLDDGSFMASIKQTWDWTKANGMNTIAALNDLFGNKEGQAAAMKAADQYLLDQNAHIFQKDKDGVLLPRISTIEQIIEDEDQLAAFGQYLKHTMGMAAASSFPIFLTAAAGAAAGSIIPGVGTAMGATAGTVLGAYVFHAVGDVYQAQKYGGAEDPSAMLALALGIPYAAVERLGIGRLPNALIRTFGSPKKAREMLQQHLFYKLNKKAIAPNFKKVPGMFIKSMGKYGVEEALAESIQETITQTAEGIAGDYNFDEMFNNQDFAKQLGEAAAAGFFGGWGFGVVMPSINTMKMLGQAGGETLEGGGEWSQINVDPVQEAFKDKPWAVGDTVESLNKYNLESKLPLFDKPKFTVLGTGLLKGTQHFILQSYDMPGVVETVPVTEAGNIYKVDTPTTSGGEPPEDPSQNYVYENPVDKEHKWYDETLQKQYNETKKRLHQSGWIDKDNNESVDTWLGGRKKVVNEVANDIELQREEQKKAEKDITEEERKELESEGVSIVSELDYKYKKYDGLVGEDLRKAVDKDYQYWRADEITNNSPDENYIDEKEETSFQKLGYNIGDLGWLYRQKLISDLTPTNAAGKVVSPTSKKAVSTRGRDRIKDIHNKQIPFSTIPENLGGPQTIQIELGEEISSVQRPLTAEESASLTGDKLIPNMRYNPILMKEQMSFEDLYELPIGERMRMAWVLVGQLDYRGWKSKEIKGLYPFIQSTLKQLEAYARDAVNQYGINSAAAKQAMNDVNSFKDKGWHILRADRKMGDIETEFRLHPIFTPKALEAAERTIFKLKRDSKFISTKPEIRGPHLSEILAYESLIKNTYKARRQLNELLKSMSIEPITVTEWETLTTNKVMKRINKLKRDINRKQTEYKKKKIKAEFIKLQVQYPGKDPEPALNQEFQDNIIMIAQMMREYLNNIGLSNIDLAVMKQVISRMELEDIWDPVKKENVKAEIPGQWIVAGEDMVGKAIRELRPVLKTGELQERISKYDYPLFPFNMIKVAFDMEKYALLPDERARAEYEINTLRALQHESIHALRAMGMFTDAEWKVLENESKKPGGFMDTYNIKVRYKGWSLNNQIEEGIAEAFSAYAKGLQYPYNNRIKKAFIRIKAFLIALARALTGRGFHNPESIFDAVQAGLVGERNRVRQKTADLNSSKEVDRITLQNPSETVVMSNNLLDTPSNRTFQSRMMEIMLGERLITKQKFDNLIKKGYLEKGTVPPVESVVIYREKDGTRRQGGPGGTVVPPLTVLEGMIFEHYRLEKHNELIEEQLRLIEYEGRDSRIGEGVFEELEIIPIGKPKPDKVFDKELGAKWLELQTLQQQVNDQYETNREEVNQLLLDKEQLEMQLTGAQPIEGLTGVGVSKLQVVRFSTEPNQIRWSTTAEGAMGMTGLYSKYISMYTHMTPDQFLSLAPAFGAVNPTRKASIRAITKGIKKGKKVAPPFLVIEISGDGITARVRGHEGRHRATVARDINGPASTIPVAVRFILEHPTEYTTTKEALAVEQFESVLKETILTTDKITEMKTTNVDAYKNNDRGRKDPVHKAILNKWLTQGILSNQDFNTSMRTSQIIEKVYQSFDQREDSGFNFGDEYIHSPTPYVKFQIGYASDPEQDMNRAEDRKSIKDIEKAGEQSLWPDDKFELDNMSGFSRFLGHMRAWAKKNTPFTFLYNTVMNTVRKTRMLQQDWTSQISRKFLPIMRDPVMSELITKALIIAEMNGAMPQVNEQDQLIFVAPAEGGAADMPVAKGEVIMLEGDVAGAFMEVRQMLMDINNELLRSDIAREHIPGLIQALRLIRRYNPELPEFQTIFNFEGATLEEISARLEQLDYAQVKYINDQLGLIMHGLAMKAVYGKIDTAAIGPSMDEGIIMEINKLLGTKDAGLLKLQNTAGQVATRNKGAYVPLMRFGDFYIKVKDNDDNLIWYQHFNTMAEAQEAQGTLRLKFPDGNISKPAKIDIEKIRQDIKEKTVTLENIAQYITDVNSKNYEKLMGELRETLAEKKADKDVIGINEFLAPRDKSVGAEGVPGYSADFTRSIMQYIAVASNVLARNRYAKDKWKFFHMTLEYARGKKNTAGLPEPDVNLEKATHDYMKYTEDPRQEFSFLRRMGFWWYLGGNMSSAILQTISLAQFTGPILTYLVNPGLLAVPGKGTYLVSKEMSAATAHVGKMITRGAFMGKSQYQDAFIDFSDLPTTTEGLENALSRAIADGTIKQGQALQEAGIMPGVVGSINMPIGSQRRRARAIRTFENVIVGGAFNTVEAASRLVAFITTYNLAMKNPKVLDNAEVLYGDDQDYQYAKQQYGRTAEALARFMTEENFGAYGKENRQQLGRKYGSLAALFMTYVSQMMGHYYRMLNPLVVKRTPKGFRIGIANPNKTKAQNRAGRTVFARMMLMLLMTGGLFSMPFTEDAEDLYNLLKKEITGLDGDVRAEFRNMLYNAGWSSTMIESMENGLIEAFLNIDVQRRLGFGVAPWSQQVRAAINVMGINTGARAEEFLGAPGSIFIDPIRTFRTEVMREGNIDKFIESMLPTSIRNLQKAFRYSPLGDGYASTGYGMLLADNLTGLELAWQAVGFTPVRIAKEREALYLEKKIDRGNSAKRTQFNARLTNAYVDIIQGGLQNDGGQMNEGQQQVADLIADLIEYNSKQPPHLQIQLDIKRLHQEAMMAVYPNYRLIKKNRKTYWLKKNTRLALGLD